MKVIDWNGFRGFYVATGEGENLELHYWAETVEECKQWIEENDKRN